MLWVGFWTTAFQSWGVEFYQRQNQVGRTHKKRLHWPWPWNNKHAERIALGQPWIEMDSWKMLEEWADKQPPDPGELEGIQGKEKGWKLQQNLNGKTEQLNTSLILITNSRISWPSQPPNLIILTVKRPLEHRSVVFVFVILHVQHLSVESVDDDVLALSGRQLLNSEFLGYFVLERLVKESNSAVLWLLFKSNASPSLLAPKVDLTILSADNIKKLIFLSPDVVDGKPFLWPQGETPSRCKFRFNDKYSTIFTLHKWLYKVR